MHEILSSPSQHCIPLHLGRLDFAIKKGKERKVKKKWELWLTIVNEWHQYQIPMQRFLQSLQKSMAFDKSITTSYIHEKLESILCYSFIVSFKFSKTLQCCAIKSVHDKNWSCNPILTYMGERYTDYSLLLNRYAKDWGSVHTELKTLNLCCRLLLCLHK